MAKRIPNDISNAEVYFSELPPKLYPEPSTSTLYCVMIDGEPLRTPMRTIIADKNERAIRALANEIEYTDKLDVSKISLYYLFCNEIDFYKHNKNDSLKQTWAEIVWNDLVLKPVNGSEVIEQFKYLTEVEKFLEENKLEYPFIPQIPFENATQQGYLKDYKKFDKIVAFMQKQIPKLTPQQMTVFVAVVHLIASPTLGLMLAKKKINALEFATTFMAMSETSSKIWGGNREEEKSLIEESTKHADIMLRYLSLFTSEKALEIKSHTSQSLLKVFLCHSSGDKPEVKRLHQRLTREEWIKPWLDEIELLPGVEWDSEIKKQVKNSDVVIVCLSTASITKEGYVQKEIRYALDIADEKPEGTIFIIPLRLEKCDVPSRLNKLHWVDYFIKDGYGKLLNSLEARAIGLRHKTIPEGES